MTPLLVILVYLVLLLALGLASNRLSRGTSEDFFVASHSIGPVLLLMSIFGTTMTAFALVGSTGESYRTGIGVYGKMASWSGLVHAAVFFFIGIPLWAFGKRHGHLTQIQYFRSRFDSNVIGYLLFPILVGLVIPYLLLGLLGAGGVMSSLTAGAFPEAFASTDGGLPPWLTGLVICSVVLAYIFVGGLRGAAWANTFQTVVFMATGVVAFVVISRGIGGVEKATQLVIAHHPEKLVRGEAVGHLQFLSYGFIPLSACMFPHLFQHWLTARSAKTFRLTVIAHPIFIMIVWVPTVLLGVWATSALMPDGSLIVPEAHPPNSELAIMVKKLTSPLLAGVLGAGILAAIMSSLDSQFLCLGTIFTEDIVLHHFGRSKFSEPQIILMARCFIVGIVTVTYLFSLAEPRHVFTLGVWCFSGFSALFPLVFASIYWKRVTTPGAIASILTTALVWFVLFRNAQYGADRGYLFLQMMPAATIFACSAVALVAVSLLTKPPRAEVVARYFPS